MATKKDNGKVFWIIIAILLILTASAVGFYLADRYRDPAAPDEAGDAVSGAPDDNVPSSGGGTSASLNMKPVDYLFVADGETGRIEHIFIEILCCDAGKLNYIRIDPKVSFTMSGKLYGELTPDNTQLPQTVTFSELYRYYRNDKAYEAGRRILNELIDLNVPYYTAIEDTVFDSFVYFKASDGGIDAGFVPGDGELKGRDFGTEGSVKGAIETAFKDAATNWEVSGRLRYLEVYDALVRADVTFGEAPVRVKNESTSLDTAGTGAMLYRILY